MRVLSATNEGKLDSLTNLTDRLRAAVQQASADRDPNSGQRTILDDPTIWMLCGDGYLRGGAFKRAVQCYDKFAKARPDQQPYLWQRGIALYMAGDYQRGADQFALHKSVNPNDVENSAWHFLCVAKLKSPQAAKQVLIVSRGDGRVPMAMVMKLLAGEATTEDVLQSANALDGNSQAGKRARMFAHLYIGLYHDASGNLALARKHMRQSASVGLRNFYMQDVAIQYAQQISKAPSGTTRN